MGWEDLGRDDPELAALGAERLKGGHAFLATVKKDGSPRIHPVTPDLAAGRLFVFMEPTSPKGYDLRRDGRFALHSAVGDPEEGQGEFLVTGRAEPVEDAATRRLASSEFDAAPPERWVLFELHPEDALDTVYDGDRPVRRRWEKDWGTE